jgi:hypothetical protein
VVAEMLVFSRLEVLWEKGVKPCQRARSCDERVRQVGHSASGVYLGGKIWVPDGKVLGELEQSVI